MGRSSSRGSGSFALVAGKRLGGALGLAVTVVFTRGFWEAALEGFAEGAAEGLGGVAIALVVTVFAILLVFATLGSQVEALSARLTAIIAGNGGALRDDASVTAWADGVACPILAILGAWLAFAGARDANASWAMLGFSALGLSLLSLVSAVVHGAFRPGRGDAPEATLDAARAGKGGEIAAVFVSVAVLSLTLSSAIFAAAPKLRGGPLAPPRGESGRRSAP